MVRIFWCQQGDAPATRGAHGLLGTSTYAEGERKTTVIWDIYLRRRERPVIQMASTYAEGERKTYVLCDVHLRRRERPLLQGTST